jgi:hypothetical protein
MSEFNIGDTVWFASCGTREVRQDCPVCFGKLSVTLELGNGERIETRCDYCGKGWEGPRGYVTEYEWLADPMCVTLTGKDVSERDGRREITYRAPNCYMSDVEDVRATKEEAEARCAIRIDEHAAEEKKRLEWSKENNKKSYSWHVGYHLREAKRAQSSLEWHTARAAHCKARVKDTPEQQQATQPK